jgi:Fe-S-cluster containining protein
MKNRPKSAAPLKEIEQFKEEILKNYPRLNRDSVFRFECHQGLSCFNACCGDVNIFLTPYDIIRLKNNLGISSSEFLSKYTISPFDKNLKYPIVLLRMKEDERKSCFFVGEEGCQVYPDRPWSCRMYPLGLASPSEDRSQAAGETDEEFYFLLEESICKGFGEKKEWTISEWLKDQGITEYDDVGRSFKEITLHHFFREGNELSPQKMEMFFTVCYDIDKFRDFVFRSSFLDKFQVDNDTRNRIEKDDVELLKFGFKWLRFALFGEGTMQIKTDVLAEKRKELNRQKKT